MNAYNFWYLVLAGNPVQTPDSTLFFQITYKTWGLLMFVIIGILALLPLAGRVGVCALKRERFTARDGMRVFFTAGVVSIAFFFLPAQIHERYAYPAILFFGAYAVMAHDYFLYILVSVAHILNINAIFSLTGLPVPFIHSYSLPEIVAGMFLVAHVIGFLQLYRMHSFTADVQVIRGAVRHWRTRSLSSAAASQ